MCVNRLTNILQINNDILYIHINNKGAICENRTLVIYNWIYKGL